MNTDITTWLVFGIIALIIVMVVSWVYSKIYLNKANCKNLDKIYSKFPLVRTILTSRYTRLMTNLLSPFRLLTILPSKSPITAYLFCRPCELLRTTLFQAVPALIQAIHSYSIFAS